MTTDALITMALVLTVTWGGFTLALAVALKTGSRKS